MDWLCLQKAKFTSNSEVNLRFEGAFQWIKFLSKYLSKNNK